MAYAPETGQHQHHDGKTADAKGKGEEADGAGAEERTGNGYHGVGGVEVSTDQKPGDQAAELAPCQPPLVQTGEVRSAPPYSPETGAGNQQEASTEDSDRYGLDGGNHEAIRNPCS